MKIRHGQLAYCTNIHAAANWADTMEVLESKVLAVRDELRDVAADGPFAIGLRLGARAAAELNNPARLNAFKQWLAETNTCVFTINGFPYGDFHGDRVKENAFIPDWSDPERVRYTQDLFHILATLLPEGGEGSVSTLPGSHKSFGADESLIRRHLTEMAAWLEELSQRTGNDLHLGLEPEPFGMIENTDESISFFERLANEADDPELLLRRIGINYDACHFAIQHEQAPDALNALTSSGIRISKIHLSNAIRIDPRDTRALEVLYAFDEPVYFHQVVARRENGSLERFADLPEFLKSGEACDFEDARVHFHIPLGATPDAPLDSTIDHAADVIAWTSRHPGACRHYEIETYTWSVLPEPMKQPIVSQIADEYRWVLDQLRA